MARGRRHGTKREQNELIISDYMREKNVTEIDPDDLTAWAINTGRMEKPPLDFFRRCKRELVKTMRDEVVIPFEIVFCRGRSGWDRIPAWPAT